MRRVRYLTLLLIGLLAMPAAAQQFVRLQSTATQGTISANGGYVELTTANVGGFGSVKVQTLDSYSGTWEVQCSLKANPITYDTAAELTLKPTDSTTTATSVTDAVGIWEVTNASGCNAIRVIATAGFAASDTVVIITATQSGGGSGGGGGAGTADSTAANQVSEIALLTTIDSSESTAVTKLTSIDSSIATLVSRVNPDQTEDTAPTFLSGPFGMLKAKDFDGAALTAVDAENDPVIAAGSLNGVAYVMLTTEDGSKSPIQLEDDAAAGAGAGLRSFVKRCDTPATSGGTDGDLVDPCSDALGRMWVKDGNPCSDPARITSAAISESTAATNEIVALSGSNLIFVCSYKFVTTAANSLNWKYGTGTDCGTGTTSIEGAQPYAANGGAAESGGGAPLFSVPAGNALCLTSTVATAHGGRVSYVSTAAP
jgi:hypothetical protein